MIMYLPPSECSVELVVLTVFHYWSKATSEDSKHLAKKRLLYSNRCVSFFSKTMQRRRGKRENGK